MKRSFSFTIFIIIAVLALCLLSSCSSCKKDSGLDEFEQLIVSTSSPEEQGEAFASAVYVVIPRSSGFELAARAKALADALTEKTGIETFLKYDSEPTVSGTFEILVGYTSRLISKENFEDLRDLDYICRYDRGAIVLGGRTESATIEAITKFENEILPGASYAAIMSENAHFEVYGEYDIEEFTLNGYPIYEYTVAHCGDSYEIAEVISKYVKENIGYTLSHAQKETYDAQNSKYIWLLLDESDEGVATISAKDGNIVMSASDLYGLSLVATDFISTLGESIADKSARVTLEGSRTLDYSIGNIDIALGFADNTGKSDFNLILNIADAINKSDSELICFYPTGNSLVNHIRNNCPASYTLLTVDVGNAKSVAILYRNDSFLSVSPERRDGTVWVTAVAKDGKSWQVRVDDGSDYPIKYHSGEILVLSGTILGDGNIDLIARAKYGSTSYDKIENRIYSESAACIKSETVAEYSARESYYGMLELELVEKYHESFIILKNTLN